MSGKPYHRGQHPRLAKAAIAAATANPDYRCPTCGLTLAQGIQRWGKNGKWEGGHRTHADPTAGYHAQHAHCNRSEGATHGNRQRVEPRARW